ncbi:hypothetical protein ACEN9X_02655 [Mucilaginibacter sp. Mucisp86]|uniref:hypothetical protein n=1 Tax=Mucilaginibacter sp. Mucisp86 TaxID=3243060 RepID=UPI0039B5CDA4
MRMLYDQAKADPWFRRFAIFCRVTLAASFLPTGFVKIMGQRFAEGLPHNNPLGHYFDALLQTGYYYTFIGITQIVIAVLLLIPRTALLGAIMYFPLIINITVLTYATRFDGTRLITMMLLGCIYLLIWDYDRLKSLLPIKQSPAPSFERTASTGRFRLYFFGGVFTILAFIIGGTFYLYEITPGNEEAECRNQCPSSKNPKACQVFCDCIYKKGQPLDSSLATYKKAKDQRHP